MQSFVIAKENIMSIFADNTVDADGLAQNQPIK